MVLSQPLSKFVKTQPLNCYGISICSLTPINANNHPDIALHLSTKVLVISCPGDVNASSKEEEKTCKYFPLARDFHLIYHMAVEVIPIVFGHIGVVSLDCVKHLRKIPDYCESLFAMLQKVTILGTIYTLQTVYILIT